MTPPPRSCGWSDSTAAYLLGALDADESRAFEEHLPTCERCRTQLADLAPAVHTLAAGVDPVEPPARLEARLMAQVEAEARLLRGAERPSAPRAKPWWRRPLQIPPAWAAAGAALLIALGGVGGALLGREQPAGTRVISVPVSAQVGPAARAQLEIGPNFARLRLRGLPQLPAGRVYQLWLRGPGASPPQPTDVLFSVRTGGTATVAVPVKPRAGRELLVTAEPDGGSRRPTSEPILAAPLS
jgi:anti-sigma-K factor RskA